MTELGWTKRAKPDEEEETARDGRSQEVVDIIKRAREGSRGWEWS